MKKLRLFIFLFIAFIFSLFFGCVTASTPSKSLPPESKLSYTEHILYGYPGTQGTILYRKGYVLDHDNNKKVASWVSYHLTDKYLVQNVKRTDNFRPDPDLPRGQRSELADYDHSGYDRGHLAPAEGMRRDKQTESETFLLSNMAPQVGVGFNRGIWKELEAKVRRWTKQRKNIYVITGPIYNGKNYETIGPNKVAVPTSFYKIIISCTPKGDNLDAIAFILPNKKSPSNTFGNYITTIDEVEKETGLDFLRDLNDQIENTLEAEKSSMW
ncbi:MAG: DNA/RNA non-specific endonuclease [Candidatus Omnitrophota bacterium]|nr:DNA/RNA non-specific endonuclease [Candidatus Omnitrophota bacterium]